jgi:hypothetical protein
MKVIEQIKNIVIEQHLDPSFNTKFIAINNPEFRDIPKEVGKNIVVSIHHFESLEKQFDKWEDENKRKRLSDHKYPLIDLEPPKDDVVQYAEVTW